MSAGAMPSRRRPHPSIRSAAFPQLDVRFVAAGQPADVNPATLESRASPRHLAFTKARKGAFGALQNCEV
jgi:hypothetical protein